MAVTIWNGSRWSRRVRCKLGNRGRGELRRPLDLLGERVGGVADDAGRDRQHIGVLQPLIDTAVAGDRLVAEPVDPGVTRARWKELVVPALWMRTTTSPLTTEMPVLSGNSLCSDMWQVLVLPVCGRRPGPRAASRRR